VERTNLESDDVAQALAFPRQPSNPCQVSHEEDRHTSQVSDAYSSWEQQDQLVLSQL